jgi:hypothetical protein
LLHAQFKLESDKIALKDMKYLRSFILQQQAVVIGKHVTNQKFHPSVLNVHYIHHGGCLSGQKIGVGQFQVCGEIQ